MLRFLNGAGNGKGDTSRSSGLASHSSGLASVGRKILSKNSKSASAPELNVKTLRSLYSSLLAEISTSTNGNYIECWGILGGQRDDNGDKNGTSQNRDEQRQGKGG